MPPNTTQPATPGPTEDELRANTYALLAALLRTTPDEALLERLRSIDAAADTASDEVSHAWRALAEAAVSVDPKALDDEFHALFIGVGRGELAPYGSHYLTGFLMEKPLGELRRELATLGFERQSGNREPEDHAAALCEVLSMLAADEAVPHKVQSRFFETHFGLWAERFFVDLEEAESAQFYRSVGQLGAAYVRLERQYLSMAV